MTLDVIAALQRVAASDPQRIAIRSPGATLSYSDLLNRCTATASRLLADGLQPGERVIVMVDNSIEFVSVYLAALSIRVVVVPWNSTAPCASLQSVIADSTPTVVLLEPRHQSWIPQFADATPSLRTVYVARPGAELERVWQRDSTIRPQDDLEPDLATIIYTSGTTGIPKGVMLSVDNMTAIADAGCRMLQLTADDRVGIFAPLFHLYGLREVDAALQAGASILIPPKGLFVSSQLQFFQSAGVTGLSAVPSSLSIVAEKYPAGFAALADTLRYLTIGTAPATAALLTRLRELLPRTRLVLTYGLTECSRVCYRDVQNPQDLGGAGNVGRPYPGVELEFLNAVDGIGRVVLRSPMVMRGYWKRPDATAAVLQSDGMLLTPDCGRIHPDGALQLLGRIDDVINSGGHKVSPAEIEEILTSHPGVAQAIVTAMPDPGAILGQVPRATVVRRDPTVTAADLLQHAARQLEPHKVPQVIEFVETIPQAALGKPQRNRN